MADNQDRVRFTDDLTIKFEGDNSIEFQQLFGYIAGIEAAYQACLDAAFHAPEMKLRVIAIEKGSFEIILQSAIGLAPTLLQHIPDVVSTFKDMMEMIKLKRELKGCKPQSIESDGQTTKIVNTEGNVSYYNCNVTNNYFNNPKIDAGLSQAFTSLERNSEPREAVTLTSAEETLRIESEAYPDISSPIVSAPIDAERKQVSTVDVDLRVARPDFVGDTMWRFINADGKGLSATIEDEGFLSDVRTGKVKLSANHVLKCRMRIELELDAFLEPTKKAHYIEEVYQATEEPKYEQIELELGNAETDSTDTLD